MRERKDITAREIAILKSFVTYPFLTRRQVTALLYSPGSYQGVNAILKAMLDRGLLSRPARPNVNDPYFYMLGKKGVQLLRDMGYDISFHPSEHSYPSHVTMDHTLAVTDTMIAINSISKVNEKYIVFEMLHDVTLKRQQKERVRFDIVTHLGTATASIVLFWEIDRGTEVQQKIREKVRNIINHLVYEYQNSYPTQNMTVLFLTTRKAQQLDNLILWVERELEENYSKHHADLFRFASMPEHMDAHTLFFEAIWRIPFEKGTYTLFTS